jgi:lysophospholipase L1-like esterase
VLRDQLPRVRDGHDLACLYTGVNDIRSPDFDADAFARDLETLAAGLAPRARRLLLVSPPHDLGRPSCAPKPRRAQELVRATAARHGAVVCDLADFGGWVDVLPDAVHPTAAGQLAIADRAAHALGAPVLPSALAGAGRGPAARARYAPAHARALARDLARRARERMALRARG